MLLSLACSSPVAAKGVLRQHTVVRAAFVPEPGSVEAVLWILVLSALRERHRPAPTNPVGVGATPPQAPPAASEDALAESEARALAGALAWIESALAKQGTREDQIKKADKLLRFLAMPQVAGVLTGWSRANELAATLTRSYQPSADEDRVATANFKRVVSAASGGSSGHAD